MRERDPVHGYGGVDYMVLALSDVDSHARLGNLRHANDASRLARVA